MSARARFATDTESPNGPRSAHPPVRICVDLGGPARTVPVRAGRAFCACGERVGVRGIWQSPNLPMSPLTRIASRSDLSPHAGEVKRTSRERITENGSKQVDIAHLPSRICALACGPRRTCSGDIMAKGLRSRLSQYGDEAFALFLRRGFLKSAGYTDEALDRPVVGILSTASDFNPCHGNAKQLAEHIAKGVRLAGGLPFVFPTISIHESFSFPTSMLLRNLMAMDTEEMLRALPMDSVVMIGGCDKTIPAQLMGAISADVPSIMVPVGPMLAGRTKASGSAPAPIAAGCGRPIAPARSTMKSGARPRQADADCRHLHGDGHRLHHGFTCRDARDELPAPRPPRGPFRAHAARRSLRRARRRDGESGLDETERTHDEGRIPQRLRRAAGDQRLHQRHRASCRHRRTRRHPKRPRRLDAIGREMPILIDLKPAGEHLLRTSTRPADGARCGGGCAIISTWACAPLWARRWRSVTKRWSNYVDDEITVRSIGRWSRASPSRCCAARLPRTAPSSNYPQHKVADAAQGPALVFDFVADLGQAHRRSGTL